MKQRDRAERDGACERLVRRAVADDEIAEGLIGDLAEETERGEAPRAARELVYRARLLALAAAYALPRRSSGAGGRPTDGLTARIARPLRYAARGLKDDGRVLTAAVLTLALGVGAATAVYAIVEAVLIRDLPYREPDGLVFLRADIGVDRNTGVVAEETYLDIQASSDLVRWAGIGPEALNPVRVGGEGFGLTSAYVTPDLFPLLGLDPVVGRHFDASDVVQGGSAAPRPVMLSHATWDRLFGRDPGAEGEIFTAGGMPYRIIGVLPEHAEIWLGPGTSVSSEVDFWWLYQPVAGPGRRRTPAVRAVGRLQGDATVDQAQAELNRITASLRDTYPDIYADVTHRAVSLHRDLVREVRVPMLALGALVLTVMLIAAANAAGLLLARARAREPLLSIKRALGATRAQIGAELTAEALLLALLVGGSGLLVAWALFALLAATAPESIPRVGAADFDPVVVAAGAGLAILTTTLATLLPAAQSLGVPAHGVLRSAADRIGGGRLRFGTRRALLAGQIALSMVLLVSALRLVGSLVRMSNVELGFDAGPLVVLEVQDHEFQFRSETPFDDREAVLKARARQTYSSLEELTSVTHVSGGSQAPFGTWPNSWSYYGTDETGSIDGSRRARNLTVAPGYFDTIGVPILAGRDFAWREVTADVPSVAIITDDVGDDLWPGESALGRRLQLSSGTAVEIVGVVPRTRVASLRGELGAQIYFPGLWVTQTIIARTVGDPASALETIRGHLETEAPWLSVSNAEPMRDAVARAAARLRFVATVVTSLAGAGLLLTCAGLFALAAYVARTRRRDTAIRVALGARVASIVRLALRETTRFLVTGVVLGLAGAVWASRLLSGVLFDVDPTDIPTLAAAAAVIVAISLIAGTVPAWGAGRAGARWLLRND